MEKVELTLQSGETLQADVVIYGIGISANEQLAREANLDTANGIVIDEACRTCDPAIFAGGDVAITRLDNGALLRCESWENANNQAQIAAAAMLGLPLLPPPWFWSDQYSDNFSLLAICVAMTGFVVATRKLRRRFGLICKTACLSVRSR